MTSRVKKCSFRNCTSNSKNDKSVRFFSFRKHDYVEWLQACNKSYIADKLKVTNLTCNYHVCSKHFNRYDYRRIVSPYKSHLNKAAIPKEFIENDQSTTVNSGQYLT